MHKRRKENKQIPFRGHCFRRNHEPSNTNIFIYLFETYKISFCYIAKKIHILANIFFYFLFFIFQNDLWTNL
jgi:hypothetical protein